MNDGERRIILASGSPRRAELLRQAGIGFDVVVSRVHEPENKPRGLALGVWPVYLAYHKAAAVQEALAAPMRRRIILAADTIVVDGDHILNKASDRAHAAEMLRSLMGRTHRVLTGVALLRGQKVRLSLAEATCRVKRMPAAWLERYLDSGLWEGKAGAYGLQDSHDPLVELISGEWSTVVGLPVSVVQRELACLEDQR